MTTNTTEPDLITEVEELLASWRPSEIVKQPEQVRELLRRLKDEVKRDRAGLKAMVELWDAEHPDDPCGCVGAGDDCRYPPTCELCVARLLMEGRDPADA